MKSLSMPINAFLSVTNKCNLSCKHCNVFLTRKSKNFTTEELIKLLSDLVTHKVFYLTISGGEPFARYDIFTLLDHLAKLPIRFHLNTNATLIDSSTAKILNKNKRLDSILVSLDGSNAEIHDKLRGKGNFEKTIKGLKYLIKHCKQKLSIFTVVNKYNFRDLENIAKLANSLGISVVQFEPLLYQGNALCHKDELSITDEESISVYGLVEKLSKKYGGLIQGNYLSMGKMFKKWMKNYGKQDVHCTKRANLCDCEGAMEKITIRPDGWVVPCDRLWDYKLGNIHKQSIKDIWGKSKPIKEFRERWLHTIDDISECKGCEFGIECHGGCPAVPYYMGKGIIGFDPMSCFKIYQRSLNNTKFMFNNS